MKSNLFSGKKGELAVEIVILRNVLRKGYKLVSLRITPFFIFVAGSFVCELSG